MPWDEVIRLCLSLKVVPVFCAPARDGLRQAMIESYNGWWQSKVWSRFQHHDLVDLQGHSQRYVAALRESSERRGDRGRPGSPGLPCWLEAQTEEAAEWAGGLSAAKQWQQPRCS